MAIGNESDLLNGPPPISYPPVAAIESAAGRAARAGGRTAARVLAADVLLLALLAAVFSSFAPLVGAPDFGAATALLLGGLSICAFAAASLYGTVKRPNPPAMEECRRVALALVLAVVAWAALSTVVLDRVIDRSTAIVVIAWMLTACLVTLVGRRSVRLRALRADPERVLIIGAGTFGQALARRLAGPREPMQVVGFVDDGPAACDPTLEGIPVFDGSSDLGAAVAATGATRLIVAFPERSPDELLETIRNVRLDTMPISIVPRFFEITPSEATTSEIGGVPVLDLYSARLSRSARLTKRAMDVALAGVGLVALAPFGLIVAAAIKLTSPGPVFFGQLRTGQNGQVFKIWKFRTMVKDAEGLRMELAGLNDMELSGPLFKIRRDPRITTVGRALRRFSLDELPQLFNVLNGTMSLVGPRPFVCHEADQMTGWGARRLDVPPGITGPWQVRGRNDVPYDEMIRLDYLYVTNWSVWSDVRLLLETIPRVLSGEGAS